MGGLKKLRTPCICDNDMQYLDLQKKHGSVDGGIIMSKLPKDGAVKAVLVLVLSVSLVQVQYILNR